MTDNRDRSLIAVILIFAGIIFLGDTLGEYNFNIFFFLRSYWPLLLIIFGFHIL
ncbi:MAG: LiaI-LiaF-like domain-containing protein, partial [Halanaerobium sp.]